MSLLAPFPCIHPPLCETAMPRTGGKRPEQVGCLSSWFWTWDIPTPYGIDGYLLALRFSHSGKLNFERILQTAICTIMYSLILWHDALSIQLGLNHNFYVVFCGFQMWLLAPIYLRRMVSRQLIWWGSSIVASRTLFALDTTRLLPP